MPTNAPHADHRVRLVADAVISAYVSEISRPSSAASEPVAAAPAPCDRALALPA
jgi:hypothetical protein